MATNKGNLLADDIRSGWKGFAGTGDAIRGTINGSFARLFGDKEIEAKNEAIAQKGAADMRATDEHFGHHHGIGSHSTLRTGGVGTSTTVRGETTSAGTHSGAPGNVGSVHHHVTTD